MKKRNTFIIAISLTITVIGIILLMNATSIGVDIAHQALRDNGGGMDTEQFHLIMNSSIRSYQILGAVLSAVGGLGSIVFGYLYCKDN